MRAVVFAAPHRLAVVDRPLPRPADGEVVIEVDSFGICGSDLLIWEGGLARVQPGVVLGHEFSGTVVDSADAAVEAGTRVVVEPLISCGACSACRAGSGNVCVRLGLYGIDADGAAASHVVVPGSAVHRVPEGVPLRHAAIAEPTAVACHMVRRAGVGADDAVLVVGGGPIGALVALVCRAAGVSKLRVSEPNPARRAILESVGLETIDPVHRPVGDGEFDISFELTAVPAAFDSAARGLRPHGTLLVGGLPAAPISVDVSTIVLRELTVLGSRVYESADFEHALALIADGSIPAEKLITREVPLEDAIAGAFERLRDSRDDMKILVIPAGAP